MREAFTQEVLHLCLQYLYLSRGNVVLSSETVSYTHLDVYKRQLKDNIDTSSTSGKLMMNIFASRAEFERVLIVERTTAGRKAALAKGKKFGRPRCV